jgi:beta-lactamase superfamily II metal-dependent hydrolase
MYEIDFHPIEKTGEAGSKSGDAITVRFIDALGTQRVVVIDGGYKYTGEALVEHIKTRYGTDYIDLVISTHPDQDHINGLATVLEQLRIGQLLIHRPHDHAADVSEYSNIEVIDALIGYAEDNDIEVIEPFSGLTGFHGALRILGPSVAYYEEQLRQDLSKSLEEKSLLKASAGGFWQGSVVGKAADLLDRVISYLPIETLTDDDQNSPRNNTSVITLLTIDGKQLMLTGDAGIESLTYACDVYENHAGEFSDAPLTFFQAPHHGSKRNLGPSILNRILGKPGDAFSEPTCFISSAKADVKHPSPKVTNALKRRDGRVCATEGDNLLHHSGGNDRGWGPATPIPALDEDDD